eukprot:TRINITY_DN4135_c1_g1_i2.p1 TRINITY_DN4135_c1_g1~~TRINITY_DN4135_c1_g1_i2.p1  ORF type:complete len:148 (-),score=22.02 TRINITY_DN4135_c1_g1_i2:449-838(-)
MASCEVYQEQIRQVFEEIDHDQSDSITLFEFQKGLQDARLQGFLESVQIQSTDAVGLFHVLDSDGSGLLDISEFVDGCVRLKGTARAIHTAKLSHENKLLRAMLTDLDGSISCMRKDLEKLAEHNAVRL